MLIGRVEKAVRMIALMGCFILAFSCAVQGAIPTKAECKAARAKLAELTSDDYKALKAKTKTNEQVGDALAQYADNEESAAGKFALLQDAFQQYVLGKSVDKAESVYSKAQTVGGMEYALEMARPSRSKLSAYATSKNAPAKALKERIVADEKSFQRVGIVKAKLKKAPGDESLCEQLGIEYAAIGDWESALAAFVTAAGEVAKVADWELNGGKGVDYTAATVGTFWWKFADNFPKRKNVEEALKLHAAMWYKLALDKDAFKGNEKTIIEKRIAETEKFDGAEEQKAKTMQKSTELLTPIKIGITRDSSIRFIGCPAGEFTMGSDKPQNGISAAHRVVISRPFWISECQITKRQWKSLCGGDIDLSDVQRCLGGYDTPMSGVDFDCLMAACIKITRKFSSRIPKDYVFRPPTDAEWEYAMKANCVDADDPYVKLLSGVDLTAIVAVMRGEVVATAAKNGFDIKDLPNHKLPLMKVATKRPNSWGIYDLFNNGGEYTMDVVDRTKIDVNKTYFANEKFAVFNYAEEERDPLRCSSAVSRSVLCRGGGHQCMCGWCSNLTLSHEGVYARRFVDVYDRPKWITIRLCIGPDLMKEKGYTAKAKKR